MATIKEILNEGLVFFKESKKLRKLLEKIEKKVEMAEIKAETIDLKIPKKDINEVIKMLKDIADNFENVEKKFKEAKGDKQKRIIIRTEHKEIKQKYKEILNKINNEKTIRIFMGIGILSAILAAASTGLTILMSLENIIGLSATIALPRALTLVGIPYIAGFGIGIGVSFLVRNIKNLRDKNLVKTIIEIKQKIKKIKAENIGKS